MREPGKPTRPDCTWDARIQRLEVQRIDAMDDLEEAKAEAASYLRAAEAEIATRLGAGALSAESAAVELERARSTAMEIVEEALRTAGAQIDESG